MYQAFILQKTPENWAKLCYVSLKPLAAWCTDLFTRVAEMDVWLKNGPPNLFWIAGMYFPQGFMTAVLQQHSRRTRIPIDTLAFQCEVKTDVFNSPLCPAAMMFADPVEKEQAIPSVGVNMYGLFMQGDYLTCMDTCIFEDKPDDRYSHPSIIRAPTDELLFPHL